MDLVVVLFNSLSFSSILILTALAHSTHKRLPQAKETLRGALALAQAEGYQRLFLDEREALATLLRAVLLDVREEPLLSYVRSLLLVFAQQQAKQDRSTDIVSFSSGHREV